jgi:hypothetical protein
MSHPDLPEELRSFIRDNISDVESAELLLLLARHPSRRFDLQAIINELRPTHLSEPAARTILSGFRERGLVVQMNDDTYQYYPVIPQLDPLVSAFAKLYNERPVSVVRTIYMLREAKMGLAGDAARTAKE